MNKTCQNSINLKPEICALPPFFNCTTTAQTN